MIVFLAGASGLCGKQLLKVLLEEERVSKVYIPVRSSLGVHHDKVNELPVDYLHASQKYIDIKPHAVFCCLGTTIKKAGSQEAFKLVDEEMPVALAAWAKQQQVSYMGVISALGSSESSPVFYNRVKGNMERRITELGLTSVGFFRPSLLLGSRSEKRFGEKVAIMVFGSIRSVVPSRWRPVFDKQVALAMWHDCLNHLAGSHYIENELMLKYPKN